MSVSRRLFPVSCSPSAFRSVLVAAILLVAGRASADRFEAKVSSDSVTIADTVQLTVTLEREGNSALESYRAPPTPDFDVVRAVEGAQQLSWSIINGRQSVRMVEEHVYLLRPKKKGALAIGPAVVKVAGQELKTKPITVRVGGVPKNMISTAPTGAVVEPIAPPSTMRGDRDVHLEATADRNRVYVGEQVNVAFRLWAASQILGYRGVADPKTDGFWSEELTPQQRSWERQVVKGREYQTMLVLQKGLFPLKPGKLTVTPLRMEITTMESAFSPTASAVAASSPVEIDVRPLPAEGRPANFPTSNVGKFELKATVDRTQVAAGDAVTLKLILSGTGNVHGVKPPKLSEKGELDGWKIYDPTVKENIERGAEIRGEKVLTYLMTPQRGGRLAIPPLELPFFDPKTGHYEVARTAVIEVDVEGDPSHLSATASGNASENVLSRQIRPLRNRAALSTRLGERLFEMPRVRLALLLTPPLAWLLVLGIDGLRRRMQRDTPRSRRRRARANARRRLKIAEYHIKAQRPPAFFAECARAIYEHLEFRLGQKVESYTLDELRTQLTQRGFSKETAESIVKELESCDFARFARSPSGPGEMRAAARRVRTLLGFIEKEQLDLVKEAA